NKLVARGSSFKPSATVIAGVTVHSTAVTPVNAEVTARWQGPDGSTINEESQSYQFTGETTLSFRIANPDGLPKGGYLLKVLLNGKEMQSAGFSIN
ncbi:MAG: hypothetical protein ABI588_06770, partial [Arenimonas sp.]